MHEAYQEPEIYLVRKWKILVLSEKLLKHSPHIYIFMVHGNILLR